MCVPAARVRRRPWCPVDDYPLTVALLQDGRRAADAQPLPSVRGRPGHSRLRHLLDQHARVPPLSGAGRPRPRPRRHRATHGVARGRAADAVRCPVPSRGRTPRAGKPTHSGRPTGRRGRRRARAGPHSLNRPSTRTMCKLRTYEPEESVDFMEAFRLHPVVSKVIMQVRPALERGSDGARRPADRDRCATFERVVRGASHRPNGSRPRSTRWTAAVRRSTCSSRPLRRTCACPRLGPPAAPRSAGVVPGPTRARHLTPG